MGPGAWSRPKFRWFCLKYIDLNSQHKSIVKEINEAVSKVFKNSAFILRQNVKQFEKKICKILKVKYCVSVNSGTDALLFALSQLNLKKNNPLKKIL